MIDRLRDRVIDLTAIQLELAFSFTDAFASIGSFIAIHVEVFDLDC